MHITHQKAKQQLQAIDKFYKEYGWIADSHILDFYLNRYWERFPHSWQTFLENSTSAELGLWLINEKLQSQSQGVNVVCPLGLQALRANVNWISLDRRKVDLKQFLNSIGIQIDESHSSLIGGRLKNIFTRHVKSKKRHEIEVLGTLVQHLTKSRKTESILDIGSGVGHLSRYLAFACKLDVTSVDCKKKFISTANKLDKQFVKIVSCKSEDEDILDKKKPSQIKAKLELNDDLKSFWGEDELRHHGKFGLVGLHTCGDLAPTVLNTFVNSPDATFVASLGCCYLKLGNKGYPLSAFVNSELQNLRFNYEALEVASHAIEIYADNLIHSGCQNLKINVYRAALELLIVRKYPSFKRLGLRNVKDFERKGFKNYAREALTDVENVHFEDTEFESEEVVSMLDDWWKVIAFYSVRLLMSSVVETTILLDRLVYLEENGVSGTIVPIFNERISPRNLAVIGLRN